MLQTIAKSLFGSANDRYLNKLQRYVDAINDLEPEIEALDDNKIKAKTAAKAASSSRSVVESSGWEKRYLPIITYCDVPRLMDLPELMNSLID